MGVYGGKTVLRRRPARQVRRGKDGNGDETKKTKGGSIFADILFRIFRWSVILIAFGFVMRGWFLSYSKYSSNENSVSMKKNESEKHRYPSITFCPMFKQEAKMTEHILNVMNMSSCTNHCGPEYDPKMLCQCNELCKHFKDCCEDYDDLCANNDTSLISAYLDTRDMTIEDIPFQEQVKMWSWDRQDFLTMFAHNEHGNPQKATYVLTNDSFWTETIPHPHQSGKCHTYDPPFESPHGWWHGIRFGIKMPHTKGGYFTDDVDEKERLFKDMTHIYIHEKGKFAFYMQDDFPNSHKLDVSWFRHHRENNIDLHYKIFTALDRPDRPCTHDPNYDFNKCVDLYFSRRTGCQAPWNYHEESDIEICQNITQIKLDFARESAIGYMNVERTFQSPLSTALMTGCPLPCTTTTITPEFSYKILNHNHYLKWMDRGADWTVHIWFKNLRFSYEKEYIVCDWTCLIGEIGGNLGFFLGGSILAFFDILVLSTRQRLSKIKLFKKKRQ